MHRAWTEKAPNPRPNTSASEDATVEGSGRHRTKKPRKTKEGGSSGGPLINEIVEARLKGDVRGEPRKTGGIPSMKVPKARAKQAITN